MNNDVRAELESVRGVLNASHLFEELNALDVLMYGGGAPSPLAQAALGRVDDMAVQRGYDRASAWIRIELAWQGKRLVSSS